MNILFVYSLQDAQSPAKPLEIQEQIHFGISYISSFLKKHGHNTKLIVLTKETKYSVIDEYLEKFWPKLICFTSVTTEYPLIADVAKYIRNSYPDIFLLVGGAHASLNPEAVISDNFDALCIGEGEKPTLELVQQIERGISPLRIPNLWIKRDSEIERNLSRPFLQDLDSLPFPDREMWQEWIRNQSSRCSILLGRGCPFQCTYCCNHAFRKLSNGAYVRVRSPDNILAEIIEVSNRFPEQKEIYLEIETFYIKKDWTIKLCSELKNLNKKIKLPLSFGVNLRIIPGADYEDLFYALKKANFQFINIGVESGSERIRREILKRNYSNDDIIRTVSLARRYGLKVCFYNLIGIPSETKEDFKETIKINRICQPDWSYNYIFFPYPGTNLYALCREQGLLKNPLKTDMERIISTLDLPGFSKKQIQQSFLWFDYNVYKGYRPLYKLLIGVVFKKVLLIYYLNRVYRELMRVAFLRRVKNQLKSIF